MKAQPTHPPATGGPTRAEWLDFVIRKVEALRFGSVQITVHEGRITQVESHEKTRFGSHHEPPPREP